MPSNNVQQLGILESPVVRLVDHVGDCVLSPVAIDPTAGIGCSCSDYFVRHGVFFRLVGLLG